MEDKKIKFSFIVFYQDDDNKTHRAFAENETYVKYLKNRYTVIKVIPI